MATMLFTASCQQEELVKQSQAGELAQVSIKVTTPELGTATRAFADGKSAKVLHYAVYNVKTENNQETLTYLPELTKEDHEINITTTVDLQLVTGNTYKVIFWADNANSPYTPNWTDANNPTVTVDYNYNNGIDNGVTCNNENYDAFFNWMTIDVDAAKTVDIDLFRPFAQLNIGTSDIVEASKAGYTLQKTQVTVKAYQTLNLWGMTVSDPTVVTFNAADYPNYDANAHYGLKASNADGYEIFPVTGYEYMAMNYLLCPEDKELVDVEFDFFADNGEAKERKYASVPVRRNWRTNIYGQLITSDVDVKVEIIPGFDNAYNKEVWDGHTLTAPQVAADGTILVGQGAELAYIANALNGGGQSNAENNGTRAGGVDYKKATIHLTNNIDLGGENWTPIKGFEGVFDGKDFTISNLNVSTEGQASAGLFADLNGGTVKNLTVKDAEIKGHYKSGVIVGDGLCARIEECAVENAKVVVTPFNNDDANHVGGIVGYLSGESVAYVKECSVKNAEITAYRDVAGVVGTANQTAEVSGCTVENVTVTADQTSEYKEVKDSNAGAIVGRIHANAKVEDNIVGEAVEVIVKGISATDLKNLVAEENATINLGAGTYVFPGNSIASGVTINCAEGTVFEGASSLNINGATVVGATFSNPRGSAVGGTINGTFKNCTFTGSNALRSCYAGETVFFENCVFDGDVYGVHFDGSGNTIYFKNCTLSGFNAFAAAIELVTFEGCTFKANGKSGYNGANLWGSAKMINTNFEFDGSVQNEWIDAIGKDKAYEFTGCTINGASILNGDYFFSRNVGTKATVDGVEYTRAEGGYWVSANGATTVATVKALTAALSNGDVKEIYLGAGEFGTIVAKSNKTIIGSVNAKVDCVNLNGAENLTLKNIVFDAAKAKLGYDGNGKAKQPANIITGDNVNKPNKGAHNLVVEACTFQGTFEAGGVAIAFTDQNRGSGASGNVTIKNCIFDTQGGYCDIYGHYCGDGMNGHGDFVIEQNAFNSTYLPNGNPVYLGRYASSTPVVVKDNQFNTVSSLEKAVYLQDHSNYGVSINASGNSFGN